MNLIFLIKTARISKGDSQTDLARYLTESPLSSGQLISNFERGIGPLSWVHFPKISARYGIKIEALIEAETKDFAENRRDQLRKFLNKQSSE